MPPSTTTSVVPATPSDEEATKRNIIADTCGSGFMRLPPELRLLVYDHLFATSPDPGYLFTATCHLARSIEPTALFAVNHAIRHEAMYRWNEWLEQRLAIVLSEQRAHQKTMWAMRQARDDSEAYYEALHEADALATKAAVYRLLVVQSEVRLCGTYVPRA